LWLWGKFSRLGKEGSASFLKKRSKKRLPLEPGPTIWAPMERSFLLLFFKKEALSFLPLEDFP
jgi:hypothetical protein